MVIEKLSIQNINAFVNLVTELWTDCSTNEAFEEYKELLNSVDDYCILINKNGNYIGFIHTSIRRDYVEGANELPVAYVEGLYVKPNFRSKGIAKKMIDEAENWAKSKNIKQIASDTNVSNQVSIEFHKSVGFTEVEQIVCFIKSM